MRKIAIIMFMCSLGVLKGMAQQAPPDQIHSFSVADCIAYAYEHQDTVKNAKLDIKRDEYKVKETTGQGLPQLNGSITFQDYLQTPTVIFGGQKFSIYQKYNNTFGANLSQLLFDGSYLVGLKASKTYKELSVKNYARSKIDANVNVTKAYYQVLVSGERIKLLNANVKQLQQQLNETSAQNKQGFVEKIDVDRLSVQLNNLVTTRDNTERLLSLSIQLLKFQMGMPIGETLTLTDKIENIKLEEGVAQLSADTAFYHNRIEYSLVQTQVELNKLDVKQKKSKFLPSLTGNASTGLTFQNNSFGSLYSGNYPSTFVGFTINIPIYNGGQRTNQLRQSEIAVQKSQNSLDNLKNGLALQAQMAQITYINGLKSLNNQRQNQKVATEVLRVTRIKYQQGVGSSIEVTQAETALEDADDKYIQGLYDALVSKVDLDKAYGRIQ